MLRFDPSQATGAPTTIRLARLDGKTLDTIEIAGTAEGLLDGRRVSLPLVIEKLDTPGVRAIRWERPNTGQCVLALSVYNGLTEWGSAAVVKVEPNGVKPQSVPFNLGASWMDALGWASAGRMA